MGYSPGALTLLPDTRWGLAAFVAVLVVLHLVGRTGYGLSALTPDLLLVALLVAARCTSAGTASGIGFLLGFLEGAMLPLTLGAGALVLTILGYLGARSRDIVAEDSLSFLALYLFFGKWAYDALMVLATGLRPGAAIDLLVVSPFAALYGTVAGLVLLALYRRIA